MKEDRYAKMLKKILKYFINISKTVWTWAYYDESVLESIPQHATKTGIDDIPTSLEINTAVHKLKENAPGESDIPSKSWKVLASCDHTFDILKNIIIGFWTIELTPKRWERGLLKILPKKGDLRLPGNYRRITLLETCYCRCHYFEQSSKNPLNRILITAKISVDFGQVEAVLTWYLPSKR